MIKCKTKNGKTVFRIRKEAEAACDTIIAEDNNVTTKEEE